MKTIFVFEDIIKITNEISEILQDCNLIIFNSCKSFFNYFPNNESYSSIENVDIFFMDFNLGDNSILKSGIYEIILKYKKAHLSLSAFHLLLKNILNQSLQKHSNH